MEKEMLITVAHPRNTETWAEPGRYTACLWKAVRFKNEQDQIKGKQPKSGSLQDLPGVCTSQTREPATRVRAPAPATQAGLSGVRAGADTDAPPGRDHARDGGAVRAPLPPPLRKS